MLGEKPKHNDYRAFKKWKSTAVIKNNDQWFEDPLWCLSKPMVLIQMRKILSVTLSFNFIVFTRWNFQASFSSECSIIITLFGIFLLKEPAQNPLTCAYWRCWSQIPSVPQTIFYYDDYLGAITTSLKFTSVEVSLSPFPYKTISIKWKLKHLSYDFRNSAQPWNLGQCI